MLAGMKEASIPDDRRTPALAAAVAELYAAFAGREWSSGGPFACTCPCCTSREVLDAMRHLPAAAVTLADLREYNGAAKWDPAGGDAVGEDMAFLLPRTLEVVAQGRLPNYFGLFLLFANHFPPMWRKLSGREREAVRWYCRALMRWRLSLGADEECEYGPMDVLEMAIEGGFDAEPLLEVLEDLPAGRAAEDWLVDLILDRDGWWREGEGPHPGGESAPDHVKRRLQALVRSSAAIKRLERIALSDSDPVRASRASLAHQFAEYARDPTPFV